MAAVHNRSCNQRKRRLRADALDAYWMLWHPSPMVTVHGSLVTVHGSLCVTVEARLRDGPSRSVGAIPWLCDGPFIDRYCGETNNEPEDTLCAALRVFVSVLREPLPPPP